MSHLDVFHLFPQLPPEIRRPIWYFSLPGPRLLRGGKGTQPPEQVPMLQVNQEARQVALEHYQMTEYLCETKTYVDFKTDMLAMTHFRPNCSDELVLLSGRSETASTIFRAEIGKVENVVMNCTSLVWLGETLSRWFEHDLHLFHSLKHVIVCFRDPREDGSIRIPLDGSEEELYEDLLYMARESVEWNLRELVCEVTGELFENLPLITFEVVTWDKGQRRNCPLHFGSAIPPVHRTSSIK